MTSPTKQKSSKRVVKAWIVVSSKGVIQHTSLNKEYWHYGVFEREKSALAERNDSRNNIVPCTITFTTPKKRKV